MKVVFRRTFLNDLKAVREKKLLDHVHRVMNDAENARSLRDLVHVKMMEGYKGMYRVRVGSFRIGLYWNGKQLEFVRFLDRKEIYRYFP